MTIKWGDPIECNGVRPDWLRGRQPLSVDTGIPGRWLYEDVDDVSADAPVEDWAWSHSDGAPNILRFKLPADHPAYIALARGFHPWSGGESAPDDWDGGEVLRRCEEIEAIDERDMRNDMPWAHHPVRGNSPKWDVIGYRKRVDAGRPSRFVNPPNLTEAEVRAIIGGYDAAHRMVEALRERGQYGPRRPPNALRAKQATRSQKPWKRR